VSQCAAILEVLADGEWHTVADIHRRAGYSRLNSRVSELRDRGHVIDHDTVPATTNVERHRYRLAVGLDAPQAAPVGADGDLRSVEPAMAADPDSPPVAGGLDLQLALDGVAA